MVKVKTSIYIDKDLWEKFKKYALRRGIEVSSLLEDLIRNNIVDELLDKTLQELAGNENYEIGFEPVEPKKGTVSDLVRVMRDERANSLSR
ncbi:hypothetical protein J4526_07390 [Desulfurococcaceae archaeon MEX13E-LK6-19]|nr:hypothetical protein J4526_07390 [Desulfurococcaceae archaeon MEX13E-LK6-19]